MQHAVAVSAVCILLGGLLWAGRVLFGSSPWDPPGASLVAAGFVLVTAVNVVAMLLSPGRWVRNSIGIVGGTWALSAIILPADPVWISAAALSGIGIALAWARPMDQWFHQVKPDRVPSIATSLALGLIWMPGVVGALAIPGVTAGGWMMAAFGLVGGWAYARALPGTLWALRLLIPPLGIITIIGLRPMAGAGVLAVTAALTFLAWTEGARLAVQPPTRRRAEPVPTLPDVAPPGLMKSAGYDRRGHPPEGLD